MKLSKGKTAIFLIVQVLLDKNIINPMLYPKSNFSAEFQTEI